MQVMMLPEMKLQKTKPQLYEAETAQTPGLGVYQEYLPSDLSSILIGLALGCLEHHPIRILRRRLMQVKRPRPVSVAAVEHLGMQCCLRLT